MTPGLRPAPIAAAVALGILLVVNPTPSLAADPESTASSQAAAQEEAMWVGRLTEARATLRAARARHAEAEHAWRDARQRTYPRGEARAELRGELDAAEAALAEAEAAYPRVLEDARRAGVSAGALRPFETP